MDDDKAIRSAKLTLGGMLEKKRAKSAVERAQGQIAPSKYLPNVPRQVHADGGVADDDNQPIDLGQAREQKQLQTFHSGMMNDMSNRMTQAMEAHQKAVDAGHFDGYEVGDVLQGQSSPLKITGRYVQKWKPSAMTLQHFDRLGAKPSIIEHEGQQYIPMLRYTSGSEEGGDNQEGSLYLDAVKATGMRKMGGLRAVKAYGGYVPAAVLPVPKLAVAKPLSYGSAQPTALEALAGIAGSASKIGETAGGFFGKEAPPEQPPAQDGHAGRAEAGGGMSPQAVAAYNALLEAYGQPLTVTSTYRDPAENQRVGGAKNSQHTHGNAYDIDTSGMSYEDRLALADMAWNAGFRGVGFYDNSMHFDVGDPRSWGPTYSRDSIPDWAQDWTQQRYGYADGGAAPTMSPLLIEEEMKRDAMRKPDAAAQTGQALDAISNAGRVGSIAGKLTGIPLGGVMGRKLAESIAMSEYGYADGGSVDDLPPVGKNRNGVPEEDAVASPLRKAEYPYMSMVPARQVYAEPLRQAINKAHAEAEVMDLPIDQIVTDVSAIGRSRVKNPAGGLPFVERINGVHHLRDGNHRVAAAMLRGDKTVRALVADMDEAIKANGRADGGYVPQRTQKAYKLFRTKGDGKLYPLFVHADKPVEMGKWLEAEEGPQGKAQGKVKSKLGDLAYRPGWHAGDLPIATHIGGKSDPSLKKPDYRPDNHVWAEVEMAADKDWQAEADSRGKGVKAHITDQVPLGGFYRYKTNPNMTGNWLIGGHMKVNRVLSDDEVKDINDQAGVADLPRRKAFADGGAVPAMFEGMHEDLQNEDGSPLELWHGTPAKQEFEAFDDAKVGTERDHGFWGRGHYLTPNYDAADDYSEAENGDRGTVMGPLHAALKNPYVWDVSDDNAAHRTLRDLQSMGIMREKSKLEPWDNLQRHHMDAFMQTMRDRGHDGVLMKVGKERGRKGISEVVVFNPNMIKHKDAEVFDPNDPRIRRAEGGEVDDNTPIDMTTARLLRNFNQNSTGPTPQAEGVFNRLADRYEKSRVAYDAAKADGVFDRVQIGDVYKYKPLPNTSPMEVVGHRMMPVERWSGDKPPKYVYHDHYPVADIKKDGETKPYSIERMEDADLYDRIKGKPRMVKAGGGSVGGMMLRMRRAGINTKDDFWNRWRDHMRAKAGPDPRLSSIMSNDSHFQRIDGMLRVHRQDADQNGLASVLNLYGPPKEQGHMAARIPREMFQDMGIEPTVENAHAAYEALPDDESGRQGFSKGGTPDDQNAGAYLAAPTAQGAISDAGRVRGGSGLLQAQDEAPLEGLPASARIPLTGQVIQAGPDPRIRAVARSYMASAGMPYNPPTKYAKVDPARAKRIAAAYDKMEDNPEHPLTRASYAAMIKETLAQYEAAKAAGFKAEFWHPRKQRDPYEASPRLAVEDVRNNNHMWVYPTYAGYGSGDPISEEDARRNPMLQLTGETWNGIPVTVNDIFRAVHDYFGHAKEGVGFRHDGEENAWRSHASMYSPLARMAMTSETRGQNSWLNFGPHGEKNRTARTEDTEFAPQKVGILPHWVHHEGAEDFMLPNDISGMLHARAKHGSDISKALAVTRSFTKDGAGAMMRLGVKE